MIITTGWLKKIQGVPAIEPEQSCSCIKLKKKQAKTVKLSFLWSDFRSECAHDCTKRVVVGCVDRPTCYVLGHSMSSNCSAVWSVPDLWASLMEKSWIGTALIECKVTPKTFRGDLKPDGDIHRLTRRGDPLSFWGRSGSVQIMLDTKVLQNAAGPSFRSIC